MFLNIFVPKHGGNFGGQLPYIKRHRFLQRSCLFWLQTITSFSNHDEAKGDHWSSASGIAGLFDEEAVRKF